MKTTLYITDKIKAWYEYQAMYVADKMCHTHYEEKDPERHFSMLEALRHFFWPTHCLLAKDLL